MFRSECNGCLSMWRRLTNKVNIMMGSLFKLLPLGTTVILWGKLQKRSSCQKPFLVYKQLST